MIIPFLKLLFFSHHILLIINFFEQNLQGIITRASLDIFLQDCLQYLHGACQSKYKYVESYICIHHYDHLI